MSDLFDLTLLLLIGTFLGTVVIAVYTPLAYYQLRRSAGSMVNNTGSVPVSSAFTWRRKGVIIPALMGIALGCVTIFLMIKISSPVTGFYPGWPDAIVCKVSMLNNQAGQSPIIYILNSKTYGRKNYGDVMRYSYAGGHGPHELWFSDQTRRLIDPLKDDPTSLDETEKLYRSSFFLNTSDCDGQSIDEIMKAGRAFNFARKING